MSRLFVSLLAAVARLAPPHVLANALLATAIAGMANYLAYRHYQRWDWTTDARFTLSERSRTVLRELDTDVDIYLFLSTAESNYQDLRELLDRYRAESARIQITTVDPDREPAEYRLVAERLGVGDAATSAGLAADVAIVMESGERRWRITRDDLVTVDFDSFAGEGETRVDVRSEQALTGGILEVTQGRPTRVCTTTGHGEWTLDRSSERDLGALRDELRRENLEITSLETRGAERVPEGCDAVFVIGPTQAMTGAEALLLRDYVRGGGNLLVAADAELVRGELGTTGLEEVLRDFGIRVDRALVLELDGSRLVPGEPDPSGPFLVVDYGDHPVTRGFREMQVPTVVQLVRSVRPVDPERATTLLSTSAQSFGETDVAGLVRTGELARDDADLAGPVSIAVATRVEPVGPTATVGEGEEPAEGLGGRVIVVGDADLFGATWMQNPQVVNYPVASAMIGWLTQREALIAIPGRSVSALAVAMSEDDVVDVGMRVVLLLPLAAMFLGFAVWWNRRT